MLPGPRGPAGASAPSQPHQPAPPLSSLKLGGPLSSAPPRVSPDDDAGDPAESLLSDPFLPEAASGAQVWGGALGGAGAPPGDQNGQARLKESHLNPGQRHSPSCYCQKQQGPLIEHLLCADSALSIDVSSFPLTISL